MTQNSDRFNTNNPNLCSALRWKGQFILSEHDPNVQASNDGLFWCMHTQTCIGPDGELGGARQLRRQRPRLSRHRQVRVK